ncbi:MAG TPA: hypothetical protein VFO77_06855, partial [Actinoplanes sp.]|nr:hypothetical protein [Actinoplanes sp.]
MDHARGTTAVNAEVTPAPAKRLLYGVAALAAVLLGLLVTRTASDISLLSILVLGAAVAGAEAIRVDLNYRQGGNASFTLGYAALAAGLLVLPGINVALAAGVGIAAWQLAEGVPRFKFAVNVAQYLAGTAAAALIVDIVSARPGPVDGRTFVAASVGILLGSAVNTVTVGGMIAAFGGRSWGATVRQLAPTSGLLSGGSVSIGVLAVVLATDHLWALPTLVVPLGLLYTASRREVHAQNDRERAVTYVEVEQGLAEATDAEQVHILLTEGVRAILGCNAAVW